MEYTEEDLKKFTNFELAQPKKEGYYKGFNIHGGVGGKIYWDKERKEFQKQCDDGLFRRVSIDYWK